MSIKFSSVFIVNFEYISHIFQVLILINFNMYCICSNKRPRRIVNFEALRCDTHWRSAVKEGGAHIKVRRIVVMKVQNFAIFSF